MIYEEITPMPLFYGDDDGRAESIITEDKITFFEA